MTKRHRLFGLWVRRPSGTNRSEDDVLKNMERKLNRAGMQNGLDRDLKFRAANSRKYRQKPHLVRQRAVREAKKRWTRNMVRNTIKVIMFNSRRFHVFL